MRVASGNVSANLIGLRPETKHLFSSNMTALAFGIKFASSKQFDCTGVRKTELSDYPDYLGGCVKKTFFLHSSDKSTLKNSFSFDHSMFVEC